MTEQCSYISGQVLSFPAVLSHASLGHQHCEPSLQLPTFPLIFSRKSPAEAAPRPSINGNNILEKENMVPGMADTLLSKVKSLVITLIQ